MLLSAIISDKLISNTLFAEQRGFSQTVSLLCGARANVYIKNRSGFAALHAACQHGHNQTCRVLLTSGCRPDIKNNVSRKYPDLSGNQLEKLEAAKAA